MARLRPLVVLVLVLVLGAAAYLGWERARPAAEGALVLCGNVDVRQVDLAFNVEGRVVELLVEEGEAVVAGQPLARLDALRYQDQLAGAEARLAARRAALARLEAGSRPEEVQKARADLAAGQATLDDARNRLARQQALVRREVISQQAMDDAVADERVARARLDALQQALALALAGPRKEEIAEARAEVAAAEADAALARHRFADTRLAAPSAGTILTRIQEPGAVILANTPVFTLAVTDPVWVRVFVTELQLPRIHPGQAARITVDAFPDQPFAGWVGFIAPSAEFTPRSVETPELRTSLVYRARVFVKNPDQRLRQGMPVTVTLTEAP
jgi:HlyD family secretion protein